MRCSLPIRDLFITIVERIEGLMEMKIRAEGEKEIRLARAREERAKKENEQMTVAK